MKETKLSFPLLGLIAGTRGLFGIGVGLLLSDRIGRKRRTLIGVILLAAGALSTIPLGITVAKRRHTNGKQERAPMPAY